MGFFRIAIYGIIFGVYAYTLAFDVRVLPRIGINWWMAKMVMLSVVNLVLQTIYSGICLICSVLDWRVECKEKGVSKSKHHVPSYWRKSGWHAACDFVYFTSAFPVGIATCLLYWGVYAVNPNAVMPDWVAKLIPFWYNQVTHTAPIVFLLIDTLLTCHHAPSRVTGSLVVLALFCFYMGIVLYVRFIDGYWLYPILEMLSDQYRILLFTIAGVLFWFLYLIGDGMNTALWGRATHVKDPVGKNK